MEEIKLGDDNRVLSELDNKIKRLEELEIKENEKETIDKIMEITDFTSIIEMNKSIGKIKENTTTDIKNKYIRELEGKIHLKEREDEKLLKRAVRYEYRKNNKKLIYTGSKFKFILDLFLIVVTYGFWIIYIFIRRNKEKKAWETINNDDILKV